jgi:zeaxanthin glucosyltransferase
VPTHKPSGYVGELIQKMGDAGPWASLKMQGELDHLRYEDILINGPEAVKLAGVDTMVVDQAEACSGTVAEFLGLPWVSLCNGLSLNSELSVPPFFTSWSYGSDPRSILRNRFGYGLAFLGSLTIRVRFSANNVA